MAKELSVLDIDAQIKELQMKRKKALAAEKEEQKKQSEKRQKELGAIVEKILGPVEDKEYFKKFLSGVASGYKKEENGSDIELR
ncbi:MAG: hypothetical protein K6G10_01590 [Butyrivibrio sp.]|nr:hypothetical protein [Butyrivibrio sp.]